MLKPLWTLFLPHLCQFICKYSWPAPRRVEPWKNEMHACAVKQKECKPPLENRWEQKKVSLRLKMTLQGSSLRNILR